ncbi:MULTISPECIES: hypothetical protein [Nostocales]|nr:MULTISPECIES: hypothetical protein [Nostocales]MBD2301241.1 hypothetical protein [Nostoc sp. FACHB-190]MBD2490496.1 hypothetical protein [Aulosira sp. FACHB-615]
MESALDTPDCDEWLVGPYLRIKYAAKALPYTYTSLSNNLTNIHKAGNF